MGFFFLQVPFVADAHSERTAIQKQDTQFHESPLVSQKLTGQLLVGLTAMARCLSCKGSGGHWAAGTSETEGFILALVKMEVFYG